jgi:phosphoglycolate phosphatase
MKSVIIFDFDGTIVDSFTMVVGIMYKLKPRWPIMPKGEVERLRGMAMLQVAQELRIPAWQIPFLLIRGRRKMNHMIGTLKVIPGMEDALRKLHADGHELYVISSNSSKNITSVLDRYKLTDCFTEIEGSVSLLGKSRNIKKLAKQARARGASNVYYVGDEARDIRAAKASKVKSIAVSWGFNNIHILTRHKPTALVFDPAELTEVIK